MPRFDRAHGGYRVFVGGVDPRVGKVDIEKEFDRFGAIMDVWVARNPPGFAFIVFKYAEDADKAVRRMDGSRPFGSRLRVEHAVNANKVGGRTNRSRSRSHSWRRRESPRRYGRSSSRRKRSPSDVDRRRRRSNSGSRSKHDTKTIERRRTPSRSPRDIKRRNSRRSRTPERDYARTRTTRRSSRSASLKRTSTQKSKTPDHNSSRRHSGARDRDSSTHKYTSRRSPVNSNHRSPSDRPSSPGERSRSGSRIDRDRVDRPRSHSIASDVEPNGGFNGSYAGSNKGHSRSRSGSLHSDPRSPDHHDFSARSDSRHSEDEDS